MTEDADLIPLLPPSDAPRSQISSLLLELTHGRSLAQKLLSIIKKSNPVSGRSSEHRLIGSILASFDFCIRQLGFDANFHGTTPVPEIFQVPTYRVPDATWARTLDGWEHLGVPPLCIPKCFQPSYIRWAPRGTKDDFVPRGRTVGELIRWRGSDWTPSCNASTTAPSIFTNYDVFLNFMEEDTLNNFTGFLSKALQREGISVFVKSQHQWKGGEIKPVVQETIRRSKISIPIFSENYASSREALEELAEVVECHRFNGQKILPTFLNVEPTDVRNQTSEGFAKSFQGYEEMFDAETTENWKEAVTFVGGIPGYDLKQVNGNQPELVNLIVEWVVKELSSYRSGDAKNPTEETHPSNLVPADESFIIKKKRKKKVKSEKITPYYHSSKSYNPLIPRLLSETASIGNFTEEFFLSDPKQMNFTICQRLMQQRNGPFSSCIQDLSYKINGEEDLYSITSPRLLCIQNCNFMDSHDRDSHFFSGSFTNYDVFLNFKVEDTRNNFTGFIYRTLKKEGINVFMDSAHLWDGDEMKPALLEVIRGSKISIPVFSKGHVESKQCLLELEEMVKCHRSHSQKILPIFYDVEPTDVRHQTSGSFARSFQRHGEKFDAQTIENWKQALTFTAGKKGYDLKQVNRNQSELVDLIVDWVLEKLSRNRLAYAKSPIKAASPSDLGKATKRVHDGDKEDSEAANIEKIQVEIFALGPKRKKFVGGQCQTQWNDESFSFHMRDSPYKINGKEDLNSFVYQHPLSNRNFNYNFMAAYDVGASSRSFTYCYDVFLNFRGEDTRNNFTGFLYRALKREGINVFIDSEGLWGGEEIKTTLLEAIQGSKISIPIFSQGYADSKWCLMELKEIVQCHRCNGQKILPVFYDVEPIDVCRQTSESFARAFRRYEEKFDRHTIKNWKEALNFAGGKEGYDLQQVNGNQSELVDLIVDRVSKELNRNRLEGDAGPSNLVRANKKFEYDHDAEDLQRIVAESK